VRRLENLGLGEGERDREYDLGLFCLRLSESWRDEVDANGEYRALTGDWDVVGGAVVCLLRGGGDGLGCGDLLRDVDGLDCRSSDEESSVTISTVDFTRSDLDFNCLLPGIVSSLERSETRGCFENRKLFVVFPVVGLVRLIDFSASWS
jgi:hypothetical protein